MTIREQLHPVSPYEGFTPVGAPDDQGWNSLNPVFQKLIEEVRPALVIEVGSWKGGSALNMAAQLKRLGLASELICVDTWLGAMEFWNPGDPERYEGLRLRHGFPNVYYTFLSNVVHAGFQDIITPFPLSSVSAALWFRKRNVQADLVYIDASHEEEDVCADLEAYWPALREGGVMFGDDFVADWPGVVRATREFAEKNGISLEEHDGFWVLRKPVASGASTQTASTKGSANADILRFAIVEAMLDTISSGGVSRESLFNIENIQRISLEKAVVRGAAPGFTLYSALRCQLHPPAPPAVINLDIANVEWGKHARFFALISLPHASAPDVEFSVQITTPDDAILLQESMRVGPLAVIGWHFALPPDIPAGSLLTLGTRVAWSAKHDFAWATWSSPMLFS
jgi:hypothetical protein